VKKNKGQQDWHRQKTESTKSLAPLGFGSNLHNLEGDRANKQPIALDDGEDNQEEEEEFL